MMEPNAKKILDNLKCPICQSSIDLIQWNHRRLGHGYNFGCVINSFHYAIDFAHWETPPRIFKESVFLVDQEVEYELIQTTNNGTTIYQQDIDAEGRTIDSPKNWQSKLFPMYESNMQLFNFSNTTPERLLTRIQTLMTFQ